MREHYKKVVNLTDPHISYLKLLKCERRRGRSEVNVLAYKRGTSLPEFLSLFFIYKKKPSDIIPKNKVGVKGKVIIGDATVS